MVRRKAASVLTCALVLFIGCGLVAAEKPQHFDSDGVKIQYVVRGKGEPVVLVHGFAANHLLNWQVPGIIDALSERYKVIALDNRGHGGSGKPHDPSKYGSAMVDDVVRLLDHLDIEKAHIVGYSMGAFITNKLVATHPERVISATLGGGGWMRSEDGRLAVLNALAASLENGDGITPLLVALTPEGRLQPNQEQLELTNRMVLAMNDPKALAAVARGMPGLSVKQEQLKANEVPVLALIGDIDPLKAGVEELSEVMLNLEVVVIEKADHMTAFNSPVFIESLQEFLAEHSLETVAAGGK